MKGINFGTPPEVPELQKKKNSSLTLYIYTSIYFISLNNNKIMYQQGFSQISSKWFIFIFLQTQRGIKETAFGRPM